MAYSPQWKISRVRLDMELRGWSQRDLARKAKVSENTVSRLMRGLPVSGHLMKRIAGVLGAKLDRYLVIEGDPDVVLEPRRPAA